MDKFLYSAPFLAPCLPILPIQLVVRHHSPISIVDICFDTFNAQNKIRHPCSIDFSDHSKITPIATSEAEE